MKYLEILEQLRKVLTSSTGVQMAFGKAEQVGGITVIPVARVSFGLGAGGGKSPLPPSKSAASEESGAKETTSQECESSEGGGGGGGFNTTPLGIYTIKDDKVSFKPLIGFKEMLVMVCVASFIWYRFLKLRVKGKTKK